MHPDTPNIQYIESEEGSFALFQIRCLIMHPGRF